MKRHVENWSVEKLHTMRASISFPEYQRQDRLWPLEKKQLLIDSILRDIDIPKLYFNRTKAGEYEVVDGQQRLWAIWGYLDGEYSLEMNKKEAPFAELSKAQRRTIQNYELQVTVIQEASDEYLRELFLRLQLGLLLVTGEKLHAATGTMKEFVFTTLAGHTFIKQLGIAERRYAKETLAAQITINSFSRKKTGRFSRTRYEDLLYFFKEYEHPLGVERQVYVEQSQMIVAVLGELADAFGAKAKDLTNRSYILSVYLLYEEIKGQLGSAGSKKRFVAFTFQLWNRLRDEMAAGFDRQNRELYVFENKLSSAPGERYQIERRHELLREYFAHYSATGKIKGDK